MEIELLPGEEVRDVVGYEGLYKVTSNGSVYKIGPDGNVVKKLRVNRNAPAYIKVPLSKNGKRTWRGTHQLVAIAFILFFPHHP